MLDSLDTPQGTNSLWKTEHENSFAISLVAWWPSMIDIPITGGGHGIGSNIATSFAEHGVGHILLVVRAESRLLEAAERLSSVSARSVSYEVANLASEADIHRIFETLTLSPDILVNNAGGYMPTPEPLLSTNMSEYWSGFTINVLGTALLTQGCLSHHLKHGPIGATPAVVVTLNTTGAYGPRVPNLSAYLASKAALARWVKTVSADIDSQVARFIIRSPRGRRSRHVV